MSKLNFEYFLARRIATPEGGRRNNVMVRIATLSVAIGMVVMIVALAVIFGFKKEIAASLSGFGSHVQIVYFDRNTSFETVPIDKNVAALPDIRKLPDYAGDHPYAITGGIMMGEEAVETIMMKGVDSTYDWSFFEKHLVRGEGRIGIVDSVRNRDILISDYMARSLGLDVGDPVEIRFVRTDAPPRRDRFRIAGIYDSGMQEMDRLMVITDLRNVQRLNGWDADQVTGIEIVTSDFSRLDAFTEEVADRVYAVEQDEELRTINIKQRYPTIFDWLKAHNVNAAVVITVMLLVALFNMIAALLIILLERTSMIGILKALGMDNRSLQKMFIIRSSFVILKGMFWGNLIGVGICFIQQYTGLITLSQSGYFLTTVPVSLGFGWWALLNLGTFLFIVALLALPTMIISLILPEKTIRYE